MQLFEAWNNGFIGLEIDSKCKDFWNDKKDWGTEGKGGLGICRWRFYWRYGQYLTKARVSYLKNGRTNASKIRN